MVNFDQGQKFGQNSCSDLMIRLPILKDELAVLEKLLPDLDTRPDLGHTIEIKKRIDKIRQEIRRLQEKG
jgi:hypothetical protein